MNISLALTGMAIAKPVGLFGAFLGGTELLVIFLAILILFGAKKIPEFAKGLGQGIKEFKKASSEVTNEFHNAMNHEAPPPAPRPPAPSETAAPPPSTVPKA
jgi:sec-independent protein translocase protein TatA